VDLRLLCHLSTASVCCSFARQSLAFSGLFQASQREIRVAFELFNNSRYNIVVNTF